MTPPKPIPLKVEVDAEGLIYGGAESRDAQLAVRVIKAANELQEAMDAAARAGLILEPNLKRFASNSAEYGSEAETFLCKIEIYRKLI